MSIYLLFPTIYLSQNKQKEKNGAVAIFMSSGNGETHIGKTKVMALYTKGVSKRHNIKWAISIFQI